MSRRWRICFLHIICLAFATKYLYQKTFLMMKHQHLLSILMKGSTNYNLRFDWYKKTFSKMDHQHLWSILMKMSTHYNLQFDWREKIFSKMNHQYLRSMLMKGRTHYNLQFDWYEKTFWKMNHAKSDWTILAVKFHDEKPKIWTTCLISEKKYFIILIDSSTLAKPVKEWRLFIKMDLICWISRWFDVFN